MKYLRRRKLDGQPVKRVTLVLRKKRYTELLKMKGTLNNSEAVEKLIEGQLARLRKQFPRKKPPQKVA